MLITSNYFLANILLPISSLLFLLGLLGIFLIKRTIILTFISVELMFLSMNLNLIIFSILNDNILGEIFVFFILTIIAAESAIGLSILISYFRIKGDSSISMLNILKG